MKICLRRGGRRGEPAGARRRKGRGREERRNHARGDGGLCVCVWLDVCACECVYECVAECECVYVCVCVCVFVPVQSLAVAYSGVVAGEGQQDSAQLLMGGACG